MQGPNTVPAGRRTQAQIKRLRERKVWEEQRDEANKQAEIAHCYRVYSPPQVRS